LFNIIFFRLCGDKIYSETEIIGHAETKTINTGVFKKHSKNLEI